MLTRAIALAAFLILSVAPASSHAILLSSRPSDRTVLPQAPADISLTFNEPVQLTRLQLVKSDGTVLRAEQSFDLAATIDWRLPEVLATGGWLLSYSVISTDSHIVSGTIRLAVGDGQVEFADVEATAATRTELPRFAMLAGTLAGAGLLLAMAGLAGRARRSLKAGLWIAVAVAAAGAAGFLAATAAASGGGAASFAAAVRILGPGAAAVTAALVAGAVLAGARRPGLAAACGVAALVGLGLSGHIAGAPPAWLSRPAHLLHAGAAALWLGSLIVLLRRRPASAPPGAATIPADPVAPLARFSRLAPWMLTLLVAAGVAMLAVQAGSIEAFAESLYGRFFALKLGLVLLLLAVAAYNRWRLTRPAVAGDERAARRLRRSIVAELVLFAGIIGTTALLGTAVPPRAYLAAVPRCAAAPVEASGRDIGLDVRLTLASGCAGLNDIAVAMTWEDGRPLAVKEVMLRFSLPDLNVEPFDVYLEDRGGGVFALPAYDLPLPGEWRVESRILLDEFTLRRVVFRVPLAGG